MKNGSNLSVCIPNYNHARYLTGVLESVLSQRVVPEEVIIVDDASTDNSREVIESFSKGRNQIRLLQNEKNRGCLYSVNRGLSEARGKYFYALAADDLVLPGFFEKTLQSLEESPRAGMAATSMKFIDKNGADIPLAALPSFHSHESHVNIRMPMYLSRDRVLQRLERQPWFLGGVVNVMFKTAECQEAGGLRPELGLLADWFCAHYVALKCGMCYIPEPLVAFRILAKSYGASYVADLERSMESHSRALTLMESRHDIFPSGFIARKRREFTYAVFRGIFVGWRESFVGELNASVPPRTPKDRLLLKLLRLLSIGQQFMLRKYCLGNIAEKLRGTN